MNKTWKKLFDNTILFAIGSIGSKFVTFLLIPLYTSYMTQKEYGYTDLLLIILNFIIPFFGLALYDSVLRFLLTKEDSEENIFSTIFIVYTILSSITIIISITISFFVNTINIVTLSVFLICQVFYVFFSQFAKGINKNKIFSFMSIFLAIILLLSSYCFFNLMNDMILAFLYSYIISYTISNILYFFLLKSFKLLNIKYWSRGLLKKMLRYSFPLIPNQSMWWIMNASNRLFITYYLGLEISGLYAVSSKIPSLLTIFTSVFLQSWQITAIDSNKDKYKAKFNSTVFKILFSSLIVIVSVILLFLQYLIYLLVDKSFFLSWIYVPWLLLSFIFSNLSQFIGMFYLTNMNTVGNFKTSLYGAFFSLTLNYLLVPIFGANGSGIAVTLSFLSVFIVRFIDTKEISKIKLPKWGMLFSFALLLTQIVLLYSDISFMWQALVVCINIIIQVINIFKNKGSYI